MTTMPLDALRLAGAAFANPRTSSGLAVEEIQALALHIGRRGLLNPLLVTEDGLIIGGQRRFLAICLLQVWRNRLSDAAHLIANGEGDILDARAEELRLAVPVRIRDGDTADEDAIADNVLHRDMSSYEVASKMSEILQRPGSRHTITSLADMVGKSRPHASLMLKTWRCAGEELRAAWRDGMPLTTVEQLAELPLEQQVAALSKEGPKRRGAGKSHGRPGIEAVKDLLAAALRRFDPAHGVEPLAGFDAGAVDALRWVAGEQTSRSFAELVRRLEES